MKLASTGTYDALQQALVRELIRVVRASLEEVEAPEEIVSKLTGSIVFSVASVLDDVAGFELNGKPVTPVLTFQTDDETLEFAGGNSWMHEYVYRLMQPHGDSNSNGK